MLHLADRDKLKLNTISMANIYRRYDGKIIYAEKLEEGYDVGYGELIPKKQFIRQHTRIEGNATLTDGFIPYSKRYRGNAQQKHARRLQTKARQ